MAQIRIKQVAQLEQSLNAITGVTTVVESYSTNQTTGNTGIQNTFEAKEVSGVKVHVNGLQIEDFSWLNVTTDYLPAGSNLVFDSVAAGFELQSTDIIKLTYEYLANGSSTFTGSGNGSTGAKGDQGFQGIQGFVGSQGFQGLNGIAGDQGYQGLKGDIGEDGNQGFQGSGSQGLKGDQGPVGPAGTGTGGSGSQGDQGLRGDQGDQGLNGTNGNQGYQGLKGEDGTKGDQGLTGTQGPVGPAGTGTGGSGSQGDQGLRGDQGNQGNQGLNGTNGNQGLKGDQGFGSQGLQGNQGLTGPAGSGGSGNISGTVDGHLIPDTNEAYDLGSPDKKFRDIYMSGNTLYMGGQPLSIDNGALTLNGNAITGNLDSDNSIGNETPGVNPVAPKILYANVPNGILNNQSLSPLSVTVCADESKIWLTDLNDDIIEVYSVDYNTGTFNLLASGTFSSLAPDVSNYGQRALKLSFDGTSGFWVESNPSNPSNPTTMTYVDLIGGNLVSRAGYVTIPANAPQPTLNKNLSFFYRNDVGFIAARYDGVNWNEEVVSTGASVNNARHQTLSSDIRKTDNNVNTIVLIKDVYEEQGVGVMEVVKYNGSVWNIEFTDNDVADAAISPDGLMLVYFKAGNYITMEYNGTSWSNLNTLPVTANSFSWGELSISVNKNTLIANEKLYTLNSNQWVEVIERINVLDQFGGLDGYLLGNDPSYYSNYPYNTSPNGKNYITFSKVTNNRLYNTFLNDQMWDIIEIPATLNNFSSNAFVYDPNVGGGNIFEANYNFWSTFRDYTNGVIAIDSNGKLSGKKIYKFTFEDVLRFSTGDSVLVHNADYTFVLNAGVISNDIANKTLELIHGFSFFDSNNSNATAYNSTFYIKRA